MNKRHILVALAFLLAFAPLAAFAADTEEMQGLTRGEFFLYIAEHLGLEATSQSFAFPQDVDTESEQAWALQALMEAGLVQGHQDGTARLSDPIIREHALIILERALGYQDADLLGHASSILQADAITGELVEAALAAVIARDTTALEWIIKSAEAMAEQESYHMASTIAMEMVYSPEVAALIGLDGQSMAMSMTMASDFHFESGIAQTLDMTMAELAELDEEIDAIVQYIVPQGSFMKMGDQWVNMSAELPFSFEELIQQQLESQVPVDLYTRGNMFVKDLGQQEYEGKAVQAIQVYGKLSFEDIMHFNHEMLQSEDLLALMQEAAAELDMVMYLSAINYIDVETGLLVASVQEITIEVIDNPELQAIHMVMSMTFSKYNEVDAIVLPEEALDAPTIEEFILQQIAELEADSEDENDEEEADDEDSEDEDDNEDEGSEE